MPRKPVTVVTETDEEWKKDLRKAFRLRTLTDEAAIGGLQLCIVRAFQQCSIQAKDSVKIIWPWLVSLMKTTPAFSKHFQFDDDGVPRALEKARAIHPSINRDFAFQHPANPSDVTRIPGLVAVLALWMDAEPKWIPLLIRVAQERISRRVKAEEVKLLGLEPAKTGAGPAVYCVHLKKRIKIGMTTESSAWDRVKRHLRDPQGDDFKKDLATHGHTFDAHIVVSLAGYNSIPLLSRMLAYAIEFMSICMIGSTKPSIGYNTYVTDSNLGPKSRALASEYYLDAYLKLVAIVKAKEEADDLTPFEGRYSTSKGGDEKLVALFSECFPFSKPHGHTLRRALRTASRIARTERIPGLPTIPFWAWYGGHPAQ